MYVHSFFKKQQQLLFVSFVIHYQSEVRDGLCVKCVMLFWFEVTEGFRHLYFTIYSYDFGSLLVT